MGAAAPGHLAGAGSTIGAVPEMGLPCRRRHSLPNHQGMVELCKPIIRPIIRLGPLQYSLGSFLTWVATEGGLEISKGRLISEPAL